MKRVGLAAFREQSRHQPTILATILTITTRLTLFIKNAHASLRDVSRALRRKRGNWGAVGMFLPTDKSLATLERPYKRLG